MKIVFTEKECTQEEVNVNDLNDGNFVQFTTFHRKKEYFGIFIRKNFTVENIYDKNSMDILGIIDLETGCFHEWTTIRKVYYSCDLSDITAQVSLPKDHYLGKII